MVFEMEINIRRTTAALIAANLPQWTHDDIANVCYGDLQQQDFCFQVCACIDLGLPLTADRIQQILAVIEQTTYIELDIDALMNDPRADLHVVNREGDAQYGSSTCS